MAGRFGSFARLVACAIALNLFAVSMASAHPHVFVEANLEILRNDGGRIVALRHVWRFDPLFSSTVLLDFDTNANGRLDVSELDEVSQIVTESIGENGFFTEARMSDENIQFTGPDRIFVETEGDQLLMFFPLELREPVDPAATSFKVSVFDPTYYVALEIVDDTSIQVTGGGGACATEIYRPDFDKLYEEFADLLTEEFFTSDDGGPELGDEWMTWIHLSCSD